MAVSECRKDDNSYVVASVHAASQHQREASPIPPEWLPRLSEGALEILRVRGDSYSSTGLVLQRWPSDIGRVLPSGPTDLCNDFIVSMYRPLIALRHMVASEASSAEADVRSGRTLFEATLRNAAAQSWLREQYVMRAIAKDKGASYGRFDEILNRINSLLSEIFNQPVELDVHIGSSIELRFRFNHRSLNFSQLPDGVRHLLGLTVDFLRFREIVMWEKSVAETKPAVLLIDELEAHLHPKWQRAVLPALKQALPDVQIIVSTHSPFVISSCRGARVHVLELDQEGNATAGPPMDAPIGESLMATVQDVFGVESRFDLETEGELARWNELRKKQAAGRLQAEERSELDRLTSDLASRSEELRMIVAPAAPLSENALRALLKDEVA